MICTDEQGEPFGEVLYDGAVIEIIEALSGLLAMLVANLVANGITPNEAITLIKKATDIAGDEFGDYLADKLSERKENGLKVLRGGLLS